MDMKLFLWDPNRHLLVQWSLINQQYGALNNHLRGILNSGGLLVEETDLSLWSGMPLKSGVSH